MGISETVLTPTPSDTPTEAAAAPGDHRSDIQGLRALAVLLVVAFHAGLPLPGGYVGVDVFFVISGFVITRLLWRELSGSGRLSFKAFYARRVRRILPALALLIVVVAVASALLQNPLVLQRRTAAVGTAAATFVANRYMYNARTGYFDAAAVSTNPLLHTWSLSVEEQFYLVFPLLLLGALVAARRFAPRAPSRHTVMVLLGVLAFFSFGLCVTTTQGGMRGILHSPARFAYYSAPTRAWEFAVGALLALSITQLSRIRPNAAIILGIAGALLVLWSARTYTSGSQFPGVLATIPVAGTAMLLVAGLGTTKGVTRLLSSRPMTRIGDVSYGWYLWHWPTMVFATAIWGGGVAVLSAAAVVSLAPTALSYRYLEQPLRSDTTIKGMRAVRVALVCILVPVLACFLLATTARYESHTANMQAVAHALTLHADEVRNCENNDPIEQRPAACVWHAPNSQGSIWLVGDSNAGHFTEPVARAATDNGYDLHVATSAGCPFADLILISNGNALSGCRRFVTQAVLDLARLKPRLVVIASDGTGYVDRAQFRFRDAVTRRIATGTAAKARVWESGVSSVVHQLADAGVPVLLVHTVPHFGTWDLGKCTALRMYLDVASCGTSLSRAQVVDDQRAAQDAEDAALTGVPNASALDVTDELCPATTCTTNHGRAFMFRDASHLTIDGALTLTPVFDQTLRARLRGAKPA